ncbi:hypothetical protein [Microbulbifer sp. VAAF005]|nr:hypothetical protein [Microbulbifer sp. VAAF005]WHI48433.1 hypothetical protein P0078_08690 [Microbulbifer sp. VAAF005]
MDDEVIEHSDEEKKLPGGGKIVKTSHRALQAAGGQFQYSMKRALAS